MSGVTDETALDLFIQKPRPLSRAGCSPEKAEISDRRVFLLTKRIERDYGHFHLTLGGLSVGLGVSPQRLGRMFKEHAGVTIHQYLKTYRMAQGAALLASTFMTVKEVASATGYTIAANFTRDFSDAYGLSPTAFRRKK
jgi:AraC family transcriptional regulator of arabinose operon